MEPMVFLTNWLITAQCFYFFYKMSSLKAGPRYLTYWMYFFLLFGASTFFGGLSHLLFHYFELAGKIPGWSLAILSITCLEYAVFHNNAEKHRLWIRLVGLQTVIIFVLLAWDFRFVWVSVQTVIGLILVLGIYSIAQLKSGHQQWKGFLIGIGWMVLSVPVVALELDVSVWFNRHDISHLLMMLCLYHFYRTVFKLSKNGDQKKDLR